MTRLSLTINGTEREIDVEPRLSLADFLRDREHLTATHIGCEHGVCGACTVLVDGAPTRSCILFAVACEGADITTLEGTRGPIGSGPAGRLMIKPRKYMRIAVCRINRCPRLSDLLVAVSFDAGGRFRENPRRDRIRIGHYRGWSMQPCQTETHRTMRELLVAIDGEAESKSAVIQDRRSERRRPLHADCELCVFLDNGDMVMIHDALARNITFMGLSVIGNVPGEIRIGQPVEVIIKAKKRVPTHLAGTVVFSRMISPECREVGISVKEAGSNAIIMDDVETAKAACQWFANSLIPSE